MSDSAAPIESAKDVGADKGAEARRWIAEIDLYEKETSNWSERARKVVKRYRDERELTDSDARRFALLWANVETLKPTLYAKTAKADVQRRWKDKDPIGRVASEIAERVLDYSMDCEGLFDQAMKAALEDYLLPGRGVLWQRYDAPKKTVGEGDAAYEDIEYEKTHDDYVFWEDFGHNAGARTWTEVYAVWRKVYLTRDELVERFGDKIGKEVPLDHKPKGISEDHPEYEMFKKARVYEIWCKDDRKVRWVSKGYTAAALEIKDDPLDIEGFFPCPKPLFATTTNDQLIPIPDYCQYQDQAEEIDNLTMRIAKLNKALRLRGLYAGNISEVKRLLDEADDTDLVPVENWAAFKDAGGLANAVVWLPVRDVAELLIRLYEARQQAKADAHEVTGIADIMRGEVDPREKAAQSTLKAQWGATRIRERQKDVARFVRDILRIKSDIIFQRFSDQTILGMANAETFSKEDQPYVGPAIQMLKNDRSRNFRIDIETDSTIQPDEAAEQRATGEFLAATGQFLTAALPVVQAAPPLANMISEMLLLGVRRFKAGNAVEGAIEEGMEQAEQIATQALQAKMAQPQDNGQGEQAQKMIGEAQAMAEKAKEDGVQNALDKNKLDDTRARIPLETEIAELRLTIADKDRQLAAAADKTELEKRKADVDDKRFNLDSRVAAENAKQGRAKLRGESKGAAAVEGEPMEGEDVLTSMEDKVDQLARAVDRLTQQQAVSDAQQADLQQAMLRLLAAPKRLVRGRDGRAVGVEVVTQAQ